MPEPSLNPIQSVLAGLPPVTDPSSILGIALSGEVHLAYLTNDLDGAIAHFEALGISPWGRMDIPLRAMDSEEVIGSSHVAFARMTGRMFELIQPLDDVAPLFPLLAAGPLEIRFHHVGARIPTQRHIVEDAATAAGADFYVRSGPRGDVVFVDLRSTLGHWLEVMCISGEKG